MSEKKPRNYCTTCGKDFTSLEGFDAHRVGAYGPGEYKGPLADWTKDKGRRCLDADELGQIGYVLDDTKGLWYNPARASRASQAFGGSSET